MIKTLGEKFSKKGFSYIELQQSGCGKVRLYSQWKDDQIVGYVVAEIKEQVPPELWQSQFEKHELFPSAEQFGKTAWQFTRHDTQSAYDKFDEVLNRIHNRK